ncbi:MAG: quinate 5-dehydrogenase [Chloroflexi bacterium]|nr:quinate 5-dehydrogenase [Chloroflexota bacterium]
MKQAVSISLGSSTRDKKVTITLFDEEITIERIGTDGDVEKAIQLYHELDGKVDAFGVGGIDLGMTIAGRYYPLHDAQKLVAGVRQTPVVDGGGLKQTLERTIAQFIEREVGDEVRPKRALITAGVDRYGSALSFDEEGYEILFGDLGFALGIPIPIRSLRGLRLLARILMPIVGRLPLEFLYPTGEKQEEIVPKFGKWYAWATVICGDCLYIKHHMPERLDGKVIATNTTTLADVEAFRQRGVRYLVTATPRLEGRSFGTNMMEAALVAVADKGRPLTTAELNEMLKRLDFKPTLQRLNE